MAVACEVCGKRARVGNRVSHANNKTKRLFKPNLKNVWSLVGKVACRVRICTACMRAGRIKKPV